jgi:hypothetical protein
MDYSDFVIVIYNPFKLFNESFRKWAGKDFNEEEYDKYMIAARKLPSKRCIIISHTEAVKNYDYLLKLINEKFEIEICDDPKKPLYRLNNEGHACKETNSLFELKVE